MLIFRFPGAGIRALILTFRFQGAGIRVWIMLSMLIIRSPRDEILASSFTPQGRDKGSLTVRFPRLG